MVAIWGRLRSGRALSLLMGAALLPPIAAGARAVADGWVPLGDNAIFAIRSLDVFSVEHFPLLGTWSAGSLGSSLDYHHPGPLLFDVLAVPVRLLGADGVAVGIAVLNAAAVALAVLFAHRRLRVLGALVAALVSSALCWSLGSQVLVEPWNPHSMVLPCLALLYLTWSIACGDLLAVPIAAAVGSLVAQTHLSYVPLVVLLGVWAAVGLLLDLRRRRGGDPGDRGAVRRRLLRTGVVSLAVVAVCWAQPLFQQFFGDGPGNLGNILESATSGEGRSIGLADATRVVADVVAVPPGWLPPSFASPWKSFTFPGDVPRLYVAVIGLLVLVGLLGGAGLIARRSGSHALQLAIATAGIAVAAALVSASSAPVTEVGVPIHHYRFLWSVGAFLSFALLATVTTVVARTAPGHVWAVPVLTTSVVLVVVVALPTSGQGSQPNWPVPVMREVARGLAQLEGRGSVLLRPTPFDWYSMAILAELRLRDIPFAVDRDLAVQLGQSRRADEGQVDAELLLALGGSSSLSLPRGAEVIVSDVSPLSRGERRELGRVRRELLDELADGSIASRLDPEIEPHLDSGAYPTIRRQRDEDVWRPEELLEAGELLFPAGVGLIDVDDREAGLVERLQFLQERLQSGTVTLAVVPAGAPVDR